MAWGNNNGYRNNNGGYNNNGYRGNNNGFRNNGYGNNGGYNNGGYNNNNNGYRGNNGGNGFRQQREQNFVQLNYQIGDRCRVRGTDIEVTIIRLGREQYECRIMSDLRTEWFYENELELMSDDSQ